jgi:Rod binding domain-containing protein
MTDAALILPPNLSTPPTQPTAAELARRANIQRTAQDFEASFLSIMFQQMFSGVETGGEFGGGQAEAMVRSFLTDAMGRQVARAGGIGVSSAVAAEMIRMQEAQAAAAQAQGASS